MLVNERKALEAVAVELLTRTMQASLVYCCIGSEFRASPQVTYHASNVAAGPVGLALLRTMGLDTARARGASRGVYRPHELWPEGSVDGDSELQSALRRVGASRCLMLVLQDREGVHGVAGLERAPDEPAFTDSDAEQLAGVVPCLSLMASTQLRLEPLEQEVAALRAVFRLKGAVVIAERAPGDPLRLRAFGHADQPELSAELLHLVGEAATRFLDDPNVASLGPLPPSEGAEAVRILPLAKSTPDRRLGMHVALNSPPQENLSRREREIAGMLVSGYTAVNIAATYNLSENTVRTYMRRLYRKLAVYNRADLVRRLLSFEPRGGGLVPAPRAHSHRAS